MKVKNHRLYNDDSSPVPYVRSPNYHGNIANHEYLVMHFTAGRDARSSINWLTDARARASAHLVIGRDGTITQLVPFDKKAWHAGISAWGDRVGLNAYSIGIELDNAGKLRRRGEIWETWFGRPVPDDEVIVATHKNESEPAGWHAYTESQLATAMEAALTLVGKYRLLDVVGHDDIAPGRKTDPGPAFPMESFRAHVMGRSGNEEGAYQTTTRLNIRSGPGTEYATLPGSPLPTGTRVLVQRHLGNWRFVDVLDPIEGAEDIEGWVHGRYLRAR